MVVVKASSFCVVTTAKGTCDIGTELATDGPRLGGLESVEPIASWSADASIADDASMHKRYSTSAAIATSKVTRHSVAKYCCGERYPSYARSN